jgi:AraC family transcriptional regulator
MRDQTLDRWLERVGRAARLLGDRLDDPPSLEELAAEAAISPFHFHRIWRALTGETVSQSLARLRIEASKEILREDATVTRAAMTLGFGTPQSFARAFRRETGQTPTAWRTDPAVAETSADRDPPLIEIIRRDAVTVIALRREGAPYTELNATFGVLWSWAEQAGLLTNLRGIYGMPLDDPQSIPVGALRYDAALAVGVAHPPAPFFPLELQAGPYARLRHTGSYDALQDETQRLVEDWLLWSGEEPADAPIVHHFLNDPDETPEVELLTDILLLLKTEDER